MIEALEWLDQLLHFLFLLAISPLVLAALSWATHKPTWNTGNSAFVGFYDPQYGEVLEERPLRGSPTWAR